MWIQTGSHHSPEPWFQKLFGLQNQLTTTIYEFLNTQQSNLEPL